MSPETIPEGIKALIFKDKSDYYKASEILFEEYRRRADVSTDISNRVNDSSSITSVQGRKKGFYYVMLMVPASFMHRIENMGIDYVALGKEKAKKFLNKASLTFLSDKEGLEYIC